MKSGCRNVKVSSAFMIIRNITLVITLWEKVEILGKLSMLFMYVDFKFMNGFYLLTVFVAVCLSSFIQLINILTN